MNSQHRVYFENSSNMQAIPDRSIDLVVTSPPYPMIQMWDEMFFAQNVAIEGAMADPMAAFELMHLELDAVWRECWRILKEGGFACINIGDATRTVDGQFRLYPNHARILSALMALGFSPLPDILWRKQTNAPNKFMGSGMLPAGAYVTLEHEYILIVRKGGKRVFKTAADKQRRQESAIFWEERNTLFSDIWMDLKGTGQGLGVSGLRKRSAAYPFEVAYRLINMYSVKGDAVLDPYLGTGTTMAAAMAAGRNSAGFEIDPGLSETIFGLSDTIVEFANALMEERLESHVAFAEERIKSRGPLKHQNVPYGFPVVTGQEKALLLNKLTGVNMAGEKLLEVSYDAAPQAAYSRVWEGHFEGEEKGPGDIKNNGDDLKKKKSNKAKAGGKASGAQLKLF